MVKQSIYLTDEWTDTMLELVLKYLEERQARRHLSELKKCADELREIIVSKLSIEDILWTTENFKDNWELVIGRP